MTFGIGWLKMTTKVSLFLSKFVYNFHKPVKGVKTKKGFYYKTPKKNCYSAEVYYPVKQQTNKKYPILFYIHGGGWTTLDKSMYQTLCRRLSKMGNIVINLNYKLAPFISLEQMVSDLELSTKYFLENKKFCHTFLQMDKSRVILCGDSAGAHLSSIIAARANTGKSCNPSLKGKIKALLLFYGVYDFSTIRETRFRDIDIYIDALFGEKEVEDKKQIYDFSTINFVDSNFPPTLLASGAIDKLHESQSKKFAEVLAKNKVPVQTVFFDKSDFWGTHGFMSVDGIRTNVTTRTAIENFLKQNL